MSDLIKDLEQEIGFIKRTWLARYDITTKEQREIARKWIKALEQDIQKIKEGTSALNIEDLTDAQLWLHDEENEKKLQSWCDGLDIDRDTLTWHQIVDCVANSVLW